MVAELTTRKYTIESLVEQITFSVVSIHTNDQLLQLREASGNNLPWFAHLSILILPASMLVLSSIFILEAIDSPSEDIGLSKSFVGLVIVPIIIGAAEHIAAAVHAHKNRRDEIEWIIEVALISSIRTSLFVLPVAFLLD